MLPEKIEIQLIDKCGSFFPLEHILFGLRIFNEDGSYHNYSNFKTDENGKVVLTRQQIIDNTELKWENAQVDSLQKTKFEIYIWNGKEISQLVARVENLLKAYNSEEKILEDLRLRGVTEQIAETAMVNIRRQSNADRQYYEFIQPTLNNEIVAKENSIIGYWSDNLPKQYQFEVSLKENTNA